MPGQMSRPLSSIVWASGGIARAGRPDRRDLAVGDDQRAPVDLGAGDRVEVGADQGEDALGLRGDLDRRGSGPTRAPAGIAVWSPGPGAELAARLVPLEVDLAVDQRQLAPREGVERDAR